MSFHTLYHLVGRDLTYSLHVFIMFFANIFMFYDWFDTISEVSVFENHLMNYSMFNKIDSSDKILSSSIKIMRKMKDV